MDAPRSTPSAADRRAKLLFLGCFIALITTAFGFVLRTMLINDWGVEFGLTDVQKGEIFGVGLWPFAVSIVLFSLVIDQIGYGRAMVFAFLCHTGSAVLTIFATDYWSLYWATFIVALGNGTVEAVINPVVATMFRTQKTKWLNILHAGWPAGLVAGGLLALTLGDADWRLKIGLLLVPTLFYGVTLLRCRFPVQERVAAGVSHKEMMSEAGGLGMLVVAVLILAEIGRVLEARGIMDWSLWYTLGAGGGIAALFGFWVGSIGRPMFVLLLLIMMPLATTELGTDSWITPLMEGEMAQLSLNPVLVLVYTSAIMMVLRLFAGPIVERLQPLGLLAASSVLAIVGLTFLSQAAGAMIFAAATIYALGKTFFWPTMLGIVSERFPKGGALTLNATGGVGMLSVGVVGAVFLGYWSDTGTTRLLQEREPALYAAVVDTHKSVLGEYEAVGAAKKDAYLSTYLSAEARKAELATAVANADAGAAATLAEALAGDAAYQELVSSAAYQGQAARSAALGAATTEARKGALARVAVFPAIMLACYVGMALWFRARGGYRAEILEVEES